VNQILTLSDNLIKIPPQTYFKCYGRKKTTLVTSGCIHSRAYRDPPMSLRPFPFSVLWHNSSFPYLWSFAYELFLVFWFFFLKLHIMQELVNKYSRPQQENSEVYVLYHFSEFPHRNATCSKWEMAQ
jgi:hypothetical protein